MKIYPHKADKKHIYFTNPGTVMNHSSDNFNSHYIMDNVDEIEIWRTENIKRRRNL